MVCWLVLSSMTTVALTGFSPTGTMPLTSQPSASQEVSTGSGSGVAVGAATLAAAEEAPDAADAATSAAPVPPPATARASRPAVRCFHSGHRAKPRAVKYFAKFPFICLFIPPRFFGSDFNNQYITLYRFFQFEPAHFRIFPAISYLFHRVYESGRPIIARRQTARFFLCSAFRCVMICLNTNLRRVRIRQTRPTDTGGGAVRPAKKK